MNINATLIGELIIILGLVMGVVCYYLGRKKTTTPVLTAVAGAVSAIIPPVALLYVLALILKKDIES